MPDGQSMTPWRCENPHHAHTNEQRGATCRPDSLLHPELARPDENES